MNRYRDFSDWLVGRMARAGLNQRELGEQVGVKHQTVHTWVIGRSAPGPGSVARLSRLFGDDIQYINRLIGREAEAAVTAPINFEDAMRIAEQTRPWFLPLSGTASAGPGSPQDGVWRDASDRGRNYQLVEITGTCLEPEVSAGDRVVVDLDGRWEWGVVVVGNYRGDVIAKRYYGDELRGHTGEPVSTSEVEIIGVAVDVTKPLRKQTG